MNILAPAYGNSNSSALSIEDDYIFDDDTTRDSYFSSNPSKMRNNMIVSSGGKLQRYSGGVWTDISQTIKGEKGDAGTDGVDGVDGEDGTSFYPQYSADDASYHNVFDADNDIYIRIVTVDSEGLETYSDGKQFVGETESGTSLTPEQETKIDSIEEVYTTEEKAELAIASAQSHVHANTTILDNTTAAFTAAYETKLASLTDRFKGVYADAVARDLAILAPTNGDYCKQSDTNSFWFYGTVWVDSGSTSTGDMLASMYDPQNIADDAFDRANHSGSQAISTIEGLSDALDDKQDASTVLDGTTESFTTEILQRIVDLENAESSGSSSSPQIVHYGSETRITNGVNFLASTIYPESTMSVSAAGLFVAPYDGLYRVDAIAQGANNNTTTISSAYYYFLYSINGGTGEKLGNSALQIERTQLVNTDLTCSTFGLVRLSVGDTLQISTTSSSYTSYIHKYQVMIEYKG